MSTRIPHFGFHPALLRPAIKPFRLYFFRRLRSTNDHAVALRKKGKLFAPAIVLAAVQTAGRGRGANTWWSGAGVLTVTFAIPIEERVEPQELPLIAGLAVRSTAASLTANRHIELKWPNDVLHEGRKLAGLLCERVNRVDLIGIGLNINVDPARAPARLRGSITSLLNISGKTFDPNEVLLTLTKELQHALRKRMEQPFATFVREYRHHDALAGKIITVIPPAPELPLTGRCEGIDDHGRLKLRTRRMLHYLLTGHVNVSH